MNVDRVRGPTVREDRSGNRALAYARASDTCLLRRANHSCIRSKYRYTTGVKYSVTTCETIKPPTTAKPNPRREAAPAPQPSAIGNVPIKAAIVVIMIGRKRIRHA